MDICPINRTFLKGRRVGLRRQTIPTRHIVGGCVLFKDEYSLPLSQIRFNTEILLLFDIILLGLIQMIVIEYHYFIKGGCL